jgi:hypothetical protein
MERHDACRRRFADSFWNSPFGRLACRGNPEKLPDSGELFSGSGPCARLDDDVILGAMRSPLRRARLGRGQSPAYGENRICWGFSARGRRRTRAKPNRSRRNAGRPRRIRCGRRPASSRTNARPSVDSTPRSLGRPDVQSEPARASLNRVPLVDTTAPGLRRCGRSQSLSARPILCWLPSSWPER